MLDRAIAEYTELKNKISNWAFDTPPEIVDLHINKIEKINHTIKGFFDLRAELLKRVPEPRFTDVEFEVIRQSVLSYSQELVDDLKNVDPNSPERMGIENERIKCSRILAKIGK